MADLITSVILTIIVIGILKDTYIVSYYKDTFVKEETDVTVTLWMLIIVFILGLIPVLNIILFISFIIVYIVKSNCKLSRDENSYIIGLRGKTYIGRSIKAVKDFLNIRI